jgi:hypothetical protein
VQITSGPDADPSAERMPDGTVRIAYHNNGNLQLSTLRCDEETVTCDLTETLLLDSRFDVGRLPESAHLGSSGVVVSYFDRTNQAVKLYRPSCQDAIC